MRKTITLFLSVLLVGCLLLSACGSNSSGETHQNKGEIIPATNAAEPDENADVPVNKIEETSADNKIKDQTVEYQTVNLGDTIELDFATITLNRVAIDEEVYPKDTSGVYMYLPDIEGKKYIHLIGTLKNTANAQYEIDNTAVHFIFDDNYEYDGYLKADAGVFRAFDYCVDPLTSVDIHLIGEIPDELINSFDKCTIQFGFKNNFERVYKTEDCDHLYQVDCYRE